LIETNALLLSQATTCPICLLCDVSHRRHCNIAGYQWTY